MNHKLTGPTGDGPQPRGGMRSLNHADDPTALWAGARIAALIGHDSTPAPKYGSREWQQTPSNDPRRAVAVIEAAELWRRYGDEEGLLAWFRDAQVVRPSLASRKTVAELNEAAKPKPAVPVQAAEGWPPVAIPGRPGWYRCLVNGRQVDVPKGQVAA
ncbi:hypothetical protein [Streptomyces achromogenes]|uniref:hypothetical protein n=1 Tax=Streptomyces achromogenes TaxID=67255 RepID=UPI001FD7E981|nr:hypothetical protein [Streptomyces achromogenes]